MGALWKREGLGLLVTIAVLAPTAAWSAQGATTRSVDCSKNKSIQDVLDKDKSDELIVEISGICQEDVVIRRDRVTLRGADPAADGLRGVSAGTLAHDAVVYISDVQHVRLEGLSIGDGARQGVMIRGADYVQIADCEIFDNGRDGLQVDADSSVVIMNTTFTGNARSGIASFGGESLDCTDCEISGSRFGLLLINGVRAGFTNGSIDASEIAVDAEAFAVAFISNVAMTGSDFSIYVGSSCEVNTFGGSLDGPVYIESGGMARLANTPQTANAPGFNLVGRAATLLLDNSSTLLGYTEVADFSRLVLNNGSVIDGDLNCLRGGDAYCADPLVDVTSTSNCGQCPKP
jgi:hypothetical protein